MKRSSFQKVGAFDETFTASGFEDIDLGYRFAQSGGRLILHERASALHNVQTSYNAFRAKCYRDGWWLGHMLQKYPGLRAELEPPHGIRSLAKKACGTCAGMFSWAFDWPLLDRAAWLRAFLAALCWHALGTSYSKGYKDYLASPQKVQAVTTEDGAGVEPRGDIEMASSPRRQ
jgi:hypothetical protein